MQKKRNVLKNGFFLDSYYYVYINILNRNKKYVKILMLFKGGKKC